MLFIIHNWDFLHYLLQEVNNVSVNDVTQSPFISKWQQMFIKTQKQFTCLNWHLNVCFFIKETNKQKKTHTWRAEWTNECPSESEFLNQSVKHTFAFTKNPKHVAAFLQAGSFSCKITRPFSSQTFCMCFECHCLRFQT